MFKKRILSAILAVAMLLTFVPALAIDGGITITAGAVTVAEGATTVSVPVSLSGNPGLTSILIDVGYDASVLTLDTVTYETEVFGAGDYTTSELTNNPYSYMAMNINAAVTGNGKLMTMNFIVKDGAAAGTYPITVVKESFEATDADFNDLYEATTVNGSVTIPQGELPPQEIEGITFDGATFEYDGAEKELTVSGTLPAGVSVAYTSNKGTDAGTYNATAVLSGEGYITKTLNATLEITKKNLTVDGLTANNKPYDGNDDATFTGGTLADKVTDDDVSFTAEGTFADVNVGENIEVTTAVTLTGADANNYTVTQPTGLTANITKRPITIKADDKPATQNGTMPDLTYTITSGSLVDQSDLTGALECSADLAVEDEYAITQGTLDATANYELTFVGGILTVTAKPTQNVTIADVATKTYGDADFTLDITDNNTALGAFTYSGNNDAVATVAADGTITIVGAGTVTITVERAETADFAAYSDTVTFTVAKKAITATATAENREYNGGVDATVAISLEGKVDGDEVSATATGTFADKNVGENKEVTLAGFTVSGADADNYEVATPSNPTANITAKALTVEGLTADNKAYDGTTVATVTGATLVGAIGGDAVALTTVDGTFASANAGENIEVTITVGALTGADAGNYTVTQPAPLTADITAMALTVTATAENKEYDGTDAADVDAELSGAVSGDDVELAPYTATFADKNVGTGKAVTLSALTLEGADAGNYTVATPAPLTANITKADVTVDAIDLDTGVATLTGVLPADTAVELDFDAISIAIEGTTATVTNLTLKGTNSENYNVTTTSVVDAAISAENFATVTLTATNGTATGAGTYLKGASVTVVATPASGYTFDGWYAGGTRVSTSASYTFTLNEDVALEARFARAAVAGGGGATAYTVKFETNGAKKIASQSVRRNGTAKEPTAPVKEGYTFAGWYTDAALTQKYDFSTTVKKSFTLYAGWTAVDDGTETELPKDQFILTIGKAEAGVWGEAKENDVAPIIVNDRTMLPARFVAENLGANVEWIPEERQVKITKGDIEIIIIIDSDVAYVNGEEVKLDSPAFIKNDRTYTPVRFIAEKLGAKVDWVEGSSQVVITK